MTTATTSKPKAAPQQNDSAGFDIVGYFKGVKSEFKQVSWPPRQQVIAETIMVIILVTIFSTIIYLIDISLAGAISLLTKF